MVCYALPKILPKPGLNEIDGLHPRSVKLTDEYLMTTPIKKFQVLLDSR